MLSKEYATPFCCRPRQKGDITEFKAKSWGLVGKDKRVRCIRRVYGIILWLSVKREGQECAYSYIGRDCSNNSVLLVKD